MSGSVFVFVAEGVLESVAAISEGSVPSPVGTVSVSLLHAPSASADIASAQMRCVIIANSSMSAKLTSGRPRE